MDNTYRSTLANSLQSEISDFSPNVRVKLLQFMIAASHEVNAKSFRELRDICTICVSSVSLDEWDKACNIQQKKEEAMFQAIALQAQNLDIEDMLNMIYSQELSKDNAREILRSLVKKLQKQASEKKEKIISDTIQKVQGIINGAIEFKQMVIKKFGSNILEYKRKDQKRIVNDANQKGNKSVSKIKKEKKKKSELLTTQKQEIDRLKYQIQFIKQKMEQVQLAAQKKR